jgi:hypothetical protein
MLKLEVFDLLDFVAEKEQLFKFSEMANILNPLDVVERYIKQADYKD